MSAEVKIGIDFMRCKRLRFSSVRSRCYAEKASVTDEVAAVEELGRRVVLVVNDDFNFKITYPRDLPLAEFVVKQRESDAES